MTMVEVTSIGGWITFDMKLIRQMNIGDLLSRVTYFHTSNANVAVTLTTASFTARLAEN